MKRFFVNANLELNSIVTIEGIEHNHIKNVLRLKPDTQIILVCGDKYDYLSTILEISKGKTICKILDKSINEYNSPCKISVFQALVKSDNMSLIVQKLTELGVNDFYPFESTFITSKDKIGKVSKLQEISNQSIKQCKRSIPMMVHEVLKFENMVAVLKDFDKIIFANECENVSNLSEIQLKSSEKIAIVVGSEGGFSSDEISKLANINALSVTLGKRILRAETATIALTSVIMYKVGQWS